MFTPPPVSNPLSHLTGVFNTFSSNEALDLLSLMMSVRHFHAKSKYNQTGQTTDPRQWLGYSVWIAGSFF